MPIRKLGVAPKGYKKITEIYNLNEDLKYFREQGELLLLLQQIIELLEDYGVIINSKQKSKFTPYNRFFVNEDCDLFFNKAIIKEKEIYIFKGADYDGLNVMSLLGLQDINEKTNVTYEDLLIALDEFSESELPKQRKIEIINLLKQINPLIEQARQKWCRKIMRLFREEKYKCWATKVDANGVMLKDLEIPFNWWVSEISLSYKGEIVTRAGSNVGDFINLHIKLNLEISTAQKAKNIHELMERHFYETPEETPYCNDYKKYLDYLSQETGLGIGATLEQYKEFLKGKANESCGWTKPLKRGEKLLTKAKIKNN